MKKLAIILVAVMGLAACQKELKSTKSPANNNVQTAQGAQTAANGYSGASVPSGSSFGSNYEVTKIVPLIQGQTTVIGNVTVANDDDYVYVTYNVLPGNKITELHLYLGDSTEIPANNSGNPIPGQFPNKITFKKISVLSYTFAFPASDVDQYFSVAAHCVANGETAWGQGTLFPNANQWGMYFNANKSSHPTEG